MAKCTFILKGMIQEEGKNYDVRERDGETTLRNVLQQLAGR